MIKEMDAKGKAKELVEKFSNQAINFPYVDTEDGQCIGSGYMTHRSAVDCALIVAHEVRANSKDWEYWVRVINEIMIYKK